MGIFYWRTKHAGPQEWVEANPTPAQIRAALDTWRRDGPKCACCLPVFREAGPGWDWNWDDAKGRFRPYPK